MFFSSVTKVCSPAASKNLFRSLDINQFCDDKAWRTGFLIGVKNNNLTLVSVHAWRQLIGNGMSVKCGVQLRCTSGNDSNRG